MPALTMPRPDDGLENNLFGGAKVRTIDAVKDVSNAAQALVDDSFSG